MKPINNIRTNHYFRAGSAKQSSNRSNLNSSSTNKNNLTELLNTSAVHEQVSKLNFNAKFGNLIGMSNQQMGRMKRNSAKFTNKSIEQLYEQNMQLKKNNHRLYQEVMQLRGKFQAKSKKNLQRVKELDLQFQKQLYWGGSKTHLISGIKHQYAKLRKRYQQQIKQLQDLKVSLMQTKLPQYKAQIQVLQVQNKKLSQKLKKIMQNSMKIDNSSKKVMQIMIVEVQQKNKKLQDKFNQTLVQLQKLKEQLVQKQKKNMFLQKLLIEKDNNNYHLTRKFKRQQKDIIEVKQKNQQLTFRIKQLKQQHKQAEKIIIAKFQQEKQIIRQQLIKQTTQSLNKIDQLVQDKRQLQISINKIKMSSSMIGGGNSKIILQRKKQMMIKKQPKDVTPQANAIATKFLDVNDTQSINGYQSASQSNQSQHHLKPREIKTANKQNSKDSKKMRKIQFADIQQIAELVKYRMIVTGTNSEEMKKYFDRTKPITLSPECMQWEDQHITMLQVKKILQAVPFNLTQNGAHSLSRYLIQDCNQQFVYCDLINQNKRQIVKSIIKSLVGEYPLSDSEIKLQIQDFKIKCRNSFYSALKTYYPHGKVSKKKFLDVLGGMGLEITEKASEIILAKVAEKSISLAQLEYDLLQSL